MKNATVVRPEQLNEFELIQTCEDFERKYPGAQYTVRPGNRCIWVTAGVVDMYYIFKDGKIVDVQVD